MHLWQRVWRRGLAPQLGRSALLALRQSLIRDDARLVQGRTMTPPPGIGLDDARVEGACALGWAGWQGEGRGTVAELERYFERVCRAADEALGEPGACRHFLDWFDTTPRLVMRRLLLAEVERGLGDGRGLAA
jgi:hypothetical protein